MGRKPVLTNDSAGRPTDSSSARRKLELLFLCKLRIIAAAFACGFLGGKLALGFVPMFFVTPFLPPPPVPD